jgi:hypothetical protein
MFNIRDTQSQLPFGKPSSSEEVFIKAKAFKEVVIMSPLQASDLIRC